MVLQINTGIPRWTSHLLRLAWVLAAVPLAAATPAPAPAADTSTELVELEPFQVVGRRLVHEDLLGGSGRLALDASALALPEHTTLGEVLERLPGVRSSSFGPAVGRPILRGLGDARVQVLADSLGTGDASGVGPDHAVALDPLLLRRVEVVRGPASLFYGNRAIGGAVNAETRVVPGVDDAGGTGWLVARGEAGTAGALGGLGTTGRRDSLAWTFNAIARASDDLRIRGLARRTDIEHGHSHGNQGATEEPNPDGILPGSSHDSHTATLGLRWGRPALSLGVGLVRYRGGYGVPFHHHADATGEPTAEVDAVRLALEQDRVEVHVDAAPAAGWLHTLRARIGHTDYGHVERERGIDETTFAVKTTEARIEGRGTLGTDGAVVFGLGLHGMIEQFRSSARRNPLGATFPATDTHQLALFAIARSNLGPFSLRAGARTEANRLNLADFPGHRVTYRTPSLAAGLQADLGAGWQADVSATRAERAPTASELFANGGHLASGLFARGSLFQFPSRYLNTERGDTVETSLRHSGAWGHLEATAWRADFDRYVFLRKSEFTDDTTGLPIFESIQRPAELYGFELEWLRIWRPEYGGSSWELRLRTEGTRGSYLKTAFGERDPLPRMPPRRHQVRIGHERPNGWRAHAEWIFVEAQRRAELNSETSTPGYTDLSLGFSLPVRIPHQSGRGRLSLGVSNLFDRAQRNHLSFLKDVAPQAGRRWHAGLEWAW